MLNRFGRTQKIGLCVVSFPFSVATSFVYLDIEGASPSWWGGFVLPLCTICLGILGFGGAWLKAKKAAPTP